MSQKLRGRDTEHALRGVELHPEPLEDVEVLDQVYEVISLFLTLDEKVVHIDFDGAAN